LSNFSVTDFMSMQNEPEFSNGDENSIKNHKKFTSTELEVPKKPATRLQRYGQRQIKPLGFIFL